MEKHNKITRLITEPPVIFPLVALFHIVCLGYVVISMADVLNSPIAWINISWTIAYTITWLSATALKKIGATIYILLTMIDLVLAYFAHSLMYTSSLVIFSLIFSIIILVFYKKMK